MNESCNRLTIFPPGKSKAAPTVIGMTTMLVKMKKSHCKPDIQLDDFNNSFMIIAFFT
ncbi:hypothetical protein [Heyndrickxia oleronia]|jgi:hypothetical protein|uniref:hypothetical protein n=1 Tax=Heyndrickxia oleronia TaxID=38875 RepID=UPI001FEF8300|nr:hypothetical protein [Heyndrickxia oleronia]MCI1761698.1 hypothetical protein [Heyndrickxia oleronia]